MFRRWLLLLTLALPIAAAAQGPDPVPLEQFFRGANLLSAQLSPQGHQLAMTMALPTRRIGLFVIDVARPDQLRRAALFSDSDVRDFRWVNESRLVFDLTDRRIGIGDQRFAAGLFSVRPDGRELRQLVQTDVAFVQEVDSVRREMLGPLHVLLGVPGTEGEEVIVGKLETDGHRSVRSVTPLRLNVVTGRATSLAYGAPDNVRQWVFDARGEPRAAVSAEGDRTKTWFRAPDKTVWEAVAEDDRLLSRWAPLAVDGQGRLWVVGGDGRGFRVLTQFDLNQRTLKAEPIVSTPGFDFSGGLVLDPGTGNVLGVRVVTDAETTIWFDARRKALQALADQRAPGYVNQISCRRCDGDDAVMLVRSFSDRDPGRQELYFAKDKRWQLLSQVRPGIDPRRMATLDFHRTQARDGRDLPLWLTLPAGAKAGERRPAVVLVHGGPWVRGGEWRWNGMTQFLASRGYVVIEPEFRGSSGFGEAHFVAGWKQWGRAMQDDVADALAWAVREGHVDKDKVCIAGASYGGYATLMGLVRHPEAYRCGVAWVAVTDPLLLTKWSWSSDMSDEARAFVLPRMLGDPVADAEMLREVSPVHQAARIKAPVLLAFGGQDHRVPIEHGNLMRDALRKAGNDPQWVVYPSEGHGWLTFANRVDFARRVEAFLAQHLK